MSNLTTAPSSDVKVLSGTGSLFDRQALRFGRLGKWAVGIGVIGVLAALAPYLWSAVSAAVALVVLGGGAVTLSAMEKPFQNFLKEKRIQMLINGARKRPVETRRRIAEDVQLTINRGEQEAKEFRSSMGAFKLKAAKIAEMYPAEAQAYQKLVARMEDRLQRKCDNLLTAQSRLNDYNEQTEKVQALWDMSIAAKEFLSQGAKLGMSFEDQLSSQTAIVQVGEELAAAISGLEHDSFESALADLRNAPSNRDSDEVSSVVRGIGSIMSDDQPLSLENRTAAEVLEFSAQREQQKVPR